MSKSVIAAGRCWFGLLIVLAFVLSRPAVAGDMLSTRQALARFVLETSACTPGVGLTEMDIEASLPKLHKSAELRVLQFVSGQESDFQVLESNGDHLVRREVIGRYLAAAKEANDKPDCSRAITPENYRFLFRRIADYADQKAYVYALKPWRRKAGMFRGELWLDAQTGAVLREWGESVKTPSWFIKTVYFVRDYTMQYGSGRPPLRRLILNARTRLFGSVDLTIWFNRMDSGNCATSPQFGRLAPNGVAGSNCPRATDARTHTFSAESRDKGVR
jgi:hypothetical protein